MKKNKKSPVFIYRTWEKILLKMKLTLTLLIFCLAGMGASTYSQTTRFDVTYKGNSFVELLRQMEEKSDFYFFYQKEDFDKLTDISIDAKNATVMEVLDEVLKGTSLDYKVVDRYVIIRKAGESRAENLQQALKVSGRVTDSSGGSLPGVSIIIKGTTIGIITDANGNYSLVNVPADATLVFSFVGMKTQEIAVAAQTKINVTMQEETIGIEEVVAIGYGTVKKEEVTSSISKVSREDFNQGAIASSPLQLVQGKIPGLAIQRAYSDPNSDVSIQLRGVSTVAGDNEPLIIIDGFPGGKLSTIAPEDIESIDILRDGSAAAIYGTRGTNGVIIVTTKRGTRGKSEIIYSGYMTYEMPKFPDLLSGDEYREEAQELKNSDNSSKQSTGESMLDYGGNTDWLDAITRSPISQVHSISLSGGNNSTNYSASLNYSDHKGVLKRSEKNAIKSRLNIEHSAFNDRLKLIFNLSASSQKFNPSDYGVYQAALMRNPTLPVYNEDGSFYETRGWSDYNPVALIEQRDRDNQATQIIGNAKISFEVFPGLIAAARGGMQKNQTLEGYYDYKGSAPSVEGGYEGSASRTTFQEMERVLETTFNYSKLLNDIHRFEILGGYSYEDFAYEGFSAGNSYFITDQYTYNNLGAGDYLSDGKATMSSFKNESKLIAFFGRTIYSYKDKYLLTASIRREGSSKFGKNNKWGTFPAVSLGWRITEEPFMQSINWLNNMKIRAGYGVTGNQGTDPYTSLMRLTTGGRMLYNGKWIQGVTAASNANPDLKWETKHELNFGVDMTLLNNRFTSSIDLYKRITKDLIYTYSVATPPNLYNETTTNVGEISNKGIELSMNAIPIQKKDFQWILDFNISYNSNKLVSLSNDEYPFDYKDILEVNTLGLSNVTTYRLEEGKPIGNMYGYIFAGFSDEGEWLYYDQNGEVIERDNVTEDDKQVMGNGLPKIYSNLTSSIRYKNFDLSFMLRGVFKFDIYNLLSLTHKNAAQLPYNVLDSSLDINLFDTPAYNSYYIEKGDFIKLDHVSLGYTFKIKNEFIKNTRIYVSGQNLCTITDYSGVDPEVEINGLGPGFDKRTGYPRTKTFSVGINVTF